jgi:hypothetical protein
MSQEPCADTQGSLANEISCYPTYLTCEDRRAILRAHRTSAVAVYQLNTLFETTAASMHKHNAVLIYSHFPLLLSLRRP